MSGSTGVTYDYGFRIYDARIAKFLSGDPLTSKYPELTPYQFASNTPIQAIDLDGLEAWRPIGLSIMATQIEDIKNYKSSGSSDVGAFIKGTTSAGVKHVGTAVMAGAIALGGEGTIPLLARAWMFFAVNPEVTIGIGGLTLSLIDPNPNSDYPGGLDDISRGVKFFVKEGSVTKFIFKASKFEFILNNLSTKNKAISELSEREITNLAKSNLRTVVLKKIGMDDSKAGKENAINFINEAYDKGSTSFFPGKDGMEGMKKTITKLVDGVSYTFNVGFARAKGSKNWEFSTISIPEVNKNIGMEIKRLKTEK